jgi:hypothetical protein
MRKALFIFILFILSFTACAQESTPTREPGMPESEEQSASTESSAELTPAEDAAVAHLSETLGIAADKITVVATEEVEWPDGCLGIRWEGLVCTDAITPGYRIVLDANGRKVEYHSDEDGTQTRPATVLLTWKREGGIAGFCDQLIVYLSGEVHGGSCKNDQYTEERLVDMLSKEELATLNDWIESYGHVNLDASDPKGISDRMVVTLEFIGLGNQETFTSANEQELLEFAQSLHLSLSK